MLMKDRVVLVTGASRGIGAATARLLGAQGAAVAVNYLRSETAADGVVDAITASASTSSPPASPSPTPPPSCPRRRRTPRRA